MKNKGFSLLELSISSLLFLILVALLFPNIKIFQASYRSLQQQSQRRKEKIEFQMLMQQLLDHSISFEENTKQAYFILDLPKATWREWEIADLEKKQKEKGDSLLLQCIFLEEKEVKKKVFILYFRDKNLRLGYYRMGYLQEGDSLVLLSEVEGSFRQDGTRIILEYKDRKNGKIEKIFYHKK